MTTETSTWTTKKGLAQMLKGGVIMDVVTPDQARIAEEAGAVAVMALERVPADIRAAGGVARMSDPTMIEGIMNAVTIPVMAKARIGHFVEAQVLEALGVDYIDESEVLTPADEANHIDKWPYKVPFVCGATNLGEALRRIGEGAAMIRSKGEAGTGDIVEAVRHLRMIRSEIRRLTTLDDAERLEHLRLDEVADPGLGHHRDRDGVHDRGDHRRVAHSRYTAGGADVGGHALECHHGNSAGILGDLRVRLEPTLQGEDPHDSRGCLAAGQNSQCRRSRHYQPRGESSCSVSSFELSRLTIGCPRPLDAAATRAGS